MIPYQPALFFRDLGLLLVIAVVVCIPGVLISACASRIGPIQYSLPPLDAFASMADNLYRSVENPAPVVNPPTLTTSPGESGPSITYAKRIIAGQPMHVITADPHASDARVSAFLAQTPSSEASFSSLVQACHPRVAVAGTYFSLSTKVPIGDIVIDGQLRSFGGFGTAFAVTANGDVSFHPVPHGHHVDWSSYATVIAAGPTLLAAGQYAVNPIAEGYHDPHVLGKAARGAVGVRADGDVVIALTMSSITLTTLAQIMQTLQCTDAIALDGGGSLCLYYDGQYIISPGRKLTNLLIIGA
jgi:hypothetical protein